MLDEYADEFGTNLESKIPGFNDMPVGEDTPPVITRNQNPQPQNNTTQSFFSKAKGQPQVQPRIEQTQTNQYAQNSTTPNYQYQSPPPPPPQQPPIYQQYVYQQQPVQPQMQQYAPPPMPNYQPPVQQPLQDDQPRSRINNIFNEESKELNELLRAEENAGCLKNVIFMATCLLVVLISFWASYTLGSKFFLSGNQKDLMSKGTVDKVVAKIKRVFVAGNDVIKTEKEFVNYRIPDSPQTPLLPPEIQNIPDRPAPPTPRKPQAQKPLVVSKSGMFRVIVGSYDTKQQAQDALANIKADGFPGFMLSSGGKYSLQIGAFKSQAAASGLVKKASEYGYNAVVSQK